MTTNWMNSSTLLVCLMPKKLRLESDIWNGSKALPSIVHSYLLTCLRLSVHHLILIPFFHLFGHLMRSTNRQLRFPNLFLRFILCRYPIPPLGYNLVLWVNAYVTSDNSLIVVYVRLILMNIIFFVRYIRFIFFFSGEQPFNVLLKLKV